MKRGWWVTALIVVGLGLELSQVQVSLAGAGDLRRQAMRTTFSAGPGFVGDPWPSVVAARRLAADARARLYDRDLSVGSAFIYPPIAAVIYRPLAALSDDAARRALAIASRALAVVLLVELAWLVGAWRRPLELAGVAAALAVFYPLLHAIELNQATMLVAALVGGAFVALDRARPALAGVLVAGAFAIKPQLVLVLPLLWWHAPRLVVAALATGVALFAASLVYAGAANHRDYLVHVLPQLARGYAYYANQSWNGWLHRLFVPGGDLAFFALPPPSPAVRLGSMLAALGTYGAALASVARWRRHAIALPWLFALAWLVTTMISPIAWQHHYVPALFVFALFYRSWRDEPRLRGAAFVVPVALAFVAIAGYFEVRHLDGVVARLAVSYLFYGALVLAAAVALAIRRYTTKWPSSVSTR